ncbi:hypothetical protein VTJ83DRAFT_2743 [Remersonia thermophila]|uniref:Uncharacterized protein n=1 Tax=Remersonia thermophila TaxID=72144 RepID=A0ABR4DKL7_9PEZI
MLATMPATELSEAQLAEQIESLVATWQQCIRELQRLQEAADAANRPVRGLGALLKVQQRALDKVLSKQSADLASISPAQYFGIKSCCWDDRWAVVKRCRGLVAVNKEFPRSPRVAVGPDDGWLAYKDQPFQERPVAIDAVVDSGATWIKFISVSPRTLEYQVVAEGWESEPESDAGHGAEDADADEGLRHTEFADTVSKIILAARWNHCPRVHLILPSLREGRSELVDRLLRFVRHRMGGPDVVVDVTCADGAFLAAPPPPLPDAIAALVGGRDPLVGEDCGRLTDALNLDPSALVALVTDLHHGPVPRQPECQQAIIRRSLLDHESDSNELVARQDILPQVLYPALRGRRLVCTRAAARYFGRLVGAIGTRSEEARAGFVLPGGGETSDAPPADPAALRRGLAEWSALPVPEDLRLPVEVVPDVDASEVEAAVAAGALPPMAAGVARDLSPLNRSVYCHGWLRRMTTVTGHRGIERQVLLAVARHWDRNDPRNDLPPDVWHRHLGGYLIHRDKPRDWRDMMPGGEVPGEVARWALPWTTWGRGISTYGLPDTKTWEGVGHSEKTEYGRRMARREGRAAAEAEEEQEDPEQDEQS